MDLNTDRRKRQFPRTSKGTGSVSASKRKPPASSPRNTAAQSLPQLSHPDRVLYPEQNITKRDLALYYHDVADWILPHLTGRPLTLVRCPQGREKQCFYQRHGGKSVDKSIRTIRV